MKTYPALDVRTDSSDLLLALVDDFGPSAVEHRDGTVRVFFQSAAGRSAAQRALARLLFVLDHIEVIGKELLCHLDVDLALVLLH